MAINNDKTTISVLIPKDDISQARRDKYRTDAVNAGLRRAVELRIAPSADQLNVRGFLNILDVGAALDQWNTAALAVVGTAYSVFQAVAAPVIAANKIAVFYKVGVEDPLLPVSQLIFRSGGALGNILYQFDLEQMYNELETVGYFSEPVVIDPQRTFAVQVTCRIATAAICRVQLGAFIIEPKGQLIAG